MLELSSRHGLPYHALFPFFLEAAILSRIRSPMISRSNWANESSMLSVKRPIEVVVLNWRSRRAPESRHKFIG